MRWRTLHAVIGAVTCGAALVACGFDGTGPSPSITMVDYLIAETDGERMPASVMALSFSMNPTYPGSRPLASSCAYNAATAFFDCPEMVPTSTMSFKLSYQLLDAAGAPMASYDAKTTAAIRTVSDMAHSATNSTDGSSFSATGHTDRTLSGLLAAHRTLDGTGTTTVSITGGSRGAITLTAIQTVTSLVLPDAVSDGPFPLSGSVQSVTYVGTQPDQTAVTATMTFNGTATATLTIGSGSSTTLTCTVDLRPGGRLTCPTP